jgi:hypothetical protein
MPAASSSLIDPAIGQLIAAAGCLDEEARCPLPVLAAVPDPRARRGVRHRLTAILGLALCAVLAGGSGIGDACRASAILARAQRRDVCPNIWASRRSDSGLPACTLSRYAATAASLAALASRASLSRCPPTGTGDGPAA